ncbi:unnamed protein product [Adineta ricciae]|uniref:Uncharacterized protein n=1 Tax=Adineta ricciae TaxID=249248 RepID=A0A815JGJ2_ADIRI|nr:unnamed protein product [Adineta ricciae]
MLDSRKTFPTIDKEKDVRSIVPYDQSIQKSAEDLLFQAARESDEEKAKEKWKKFRQQIEDENSSSNQVKTLINSLDNHKRWAPLHYAVEANNKYVFQQLTSGNKTYRSDININGGNGENVLHIAAESDKIWTNKSNTVHENASEILTLDSAVEQTLCNLPDIVQNMLNLRADVNDRDIEGRTPLHLAVQNSRYEYARALIKLGAEILTTSMFKESVLHCMFSSSQTNSQKLEELIDDILSRLDDTQKQKFIQMTTLDNHNALGYALCNSAVNESILFKLFIDKNHIPDNQLLVAFDTLAHHAQDLTEDMKYNLTSLLNKMNIKHHTMFEHLPHILCRHNNSSLLTWFHDEFIKINLRNSVRPVDFNRFDSGGYTLLLTAVFYNAKDCVDVILKQASYSRQYLSARNNNDENVLHLCAKHSVHDDLFNIIWNTLSDVYQEKMELVLQRDIEEKTPLQVAARFANENMCQHLSNYAPLTDDFKREAAREASAAGHLNILEIIFAYDKETKQSRLQPAKIQNISRTGDKYEHTCLHFAAEKGYDDIVKFFLATTTIQVDCLDKRRRTPLHLACENGHIKVVQLLLQANASTTLRNAHVYNCLEIAITHQRKDIVQELFKHSAWKEMMRNAQPIENTEAFDTPMRKLIRYMPDMAVWLINNKFTRIVGGPGEKVYKTIYDYEFYEDMFKVKHWYSPNPDSNFELPTCTSLWRTRGVEAIHTCWCCCHPTGFEGCCGYRNRRVDKEECYTNDAYTLVRNHPLFIVSQQTHSPELVQHFYHTHLRQVKLRSFGLVFFIFSYFLYTAYIGLYTSLILKGKHPKYFYDQAQVNLTLELSTCEYVSNYIINNGHVNNEGLKSETYKRIKWTLYIILIIFTIKNLICIAALFPKVLRIGGSYVEMSALVLSYIYILDWKDWQNDVTLRCPLQYQIGAMGLLISYINVLAYVRTSPALDMGIYIVMLQVISTKFLRFLPVFLTIVCGFGLTYWMLLQYQPVYGTPMEALLRTGFMLFDLGYEDRLYDAENGGVGYYKLVYVIFALTAIGCSIFVINLLIGLAVGEIPTLMTQGTLWRISILFNLLSDYEMLRVRLVHTFDCVTCHKLRHWRVMGFRPRPYYTLEKDELKSPMGLLGKLCNYTKKHFFKEQIQNNIKPSFQLHGEKD